MELENLSTAELKQACKDAGVADYGSKRDMIERLQENAAQQVSANKTPEVKDWKANTQEYQNRTYTNEEVQALVSAKVAEATKRLITPSQDEVTKLLQTHTGYSKREIGDTLDYIKSRFPGINVRIDEHQEVFQFSGGKQGTVTTTVKQNPKAVIKVAEQYMNIASANAVDFMASVGKLGE